MNLKTSLFLCAFFMIPWAHADEPEVGGAQYLEEREEQSVVRSKRYYKAGKVELGVGGGILPYDSLFNQVMVGGRLTWHISDHYGWEIVDFQLPFGSTSSQITSLVTNTQNNIQNLEAVKLGTSIGSSFLMSPFYGKIHFFGSQVAYLDIYVSLGLGLVNTQTLGFSFAVPTATQVSRGWDPSLNYGIGFKFFLNNSFTFFVDLRNYMTYSATYGRRGFGSNFSASGGISIFLPGFG